jgi:hypothetical protein
MYPKNNQLPQVNSRQAQKTPGVLNNAFNLNNISAGMQNTKIQAAPSPIGQTNLQHIGSSIKNYLTKPAEAPTGTGLLPMAINWANTPYTSSLYGENNNKTADLAYPGANGKVTTAKKQTANAAQSSTPTSNLPVFGKGQDASNLPVFGKGQDASMLVNNPNLPVRVGGSAGSSVPEVATANTPVPATNSGYTPEQVSAPDFSLYRNAFNPTTAENTLNSQIDGYTQAHANENLGINQAGGTIWKSAGEGEQGLNDVRYATNTEPLTKRLANLMTTRKDIATGEYNIANANNTANNTNISARNEAGMFNLNRQDKLNAQKLADNKLIEVNKGATMYNPATGEFTQAPGSTSTGNLTPSEALAREKFDYEKEKDRIVQSTGGKISGESTNKLLASKGIQTMLNSFLERNPSDNIEGAGILGGRNLDMFTGEAGIANRQAIAGINLQTQFWASGAALSTPQTKLVEQMIPNQTDTDGVIFQKIKALSGFMQDYDKGIYAANGIANQSGVQVGSNQPSGTLTWDDL